MPWKFVPTQRSVRLHPGQSTLAFYTAENRCDKAVTGVSTYNVAPQQAGQYFNKIQCFCFEVGRCCAGQGSTELGGNCSAGRGPRRRWGDCCSACRLHLRPASPAATSQEQKLRPGERIDMPVFFYIDPEFATDPKMKGINTITLRCVWGAAPRPRPACGCSLCPAGHARLACWWACSINPPCRMLTCSYTFFKVAEEDVEEDTEAAASPAPALAVAAPAP
jgi:cytochrome c oxidase assembly protein Cox11